MALPKTKASLSETHPALADQAKDWNPKDYSAGSDAQMQWNCQLGHVWKARISDRAQGSGKCPTCIGKRVLKGFNDLATINPKLASQAHGWDPESITSSSNKSLEWKCDKGHIWVAKPSNRVKNKLSHCPVCIGKKLLIGFNDLATTHPDLAQEALNWDPQTLQAGSRKQVMWKCKKGHTWIARVHSRSAQGSGCRKCGGVKKSKESKRPRSTGISQSLLEVNPKLAHDAYGWDPSSVSSGSNKIQNWKCEMEHVWQATVYSRTHGSGCPICSGKKVLPGFNDLASLIPELAVEAQGWDPREFSIKSNKIVAWKCKLGHEWKAKIASRTSGRGCPICAGNRILIGFNDLQTTHPSIALEAVNVDPRSVTSGSELKVKWKCSENHQYISAVKDRTAGHGCPSCAKTGFDQTKIGWVYLLRHPAWGLLQIGITNVPRKRIAKHKSIGWELLDLHGPISGKTAMALEGKWLTYIRETNAQEDISNVAGKFDGYSECWFQERLSIDTIHELKNILKNNKR